MVERDDSMAEGLTVYEAALDFLKERAADLFFVISGTGRIEAANRYARDFTGRNPVGENFRDIIVDFRDEFDLEACQKASSGEKMINVGNSDGFPQTFYFTFRQMADRTLAFGRLDTGEIEKFRRDLVRTNQELNNLTRELHRKTAQLQDALDHVKRLQGIIPICMHCHSIRNDRQIWEKLEAYLSEHSEAELSHSICPACAEKYYPGYDIYDK